MATDPGSGLAPEDRERLDALSRARSLSDLVDLTGAGSDHDAYIAAKGEWRELRDRDLPPPETEGFPGDTVTVDGHEFHVHGITHADTDAEGAFCREHVERFLDRGATVYCEQGIRPMYFSDLPGVCAMDDYRWAMERCRELDVDSRIAGEFDELADDVRSLAGEFREAAFDLIDAGDDAHGEGFRRALGDVASGFLTSHADMATGEGFEAFTRSRRAATDPEELGALQRYYATTFLPQPVEREWLRRHDPELELVTHARNERMADYSVYHNETAAEVHLIVGAAHQPGVVYYLERHRDGERTTEGFDPL